MSGDYTSAVSGDSASTAQWVCSRLPLVPVVCDPGMVHSRLRADTCTSCASGWFKNEDMAHATICARKRTECHGGGHTLLPHAAVFGSESTLHDDTFCMAKTPDKLCPPGSRLHQPTADGDHHCVAPPPLPRLF